MYCDIRWSCHVAANHSLSLLIGPDTQPPTSVMSWMSLPGSRSGLAARTLGRHPRQQLVAQLVGIVAGVGPRRGRPVRLEAAVQDVGARSRHHVHVQPAARALRRSGPGLERRLLERERVEVEVGDGRRARRARHVHAVHHVLVLAAGRRGRRCPRRSNASEPPTSILLTTTPGMTRAIDHTSVRFGSACSSSLVSTVCFRALVVSSSGVAPVTMMASSMAPIWSRRSARAVASALTVMFGCTTGRKPASSARTV